MEQFLPTKHSVVLNMASNSARRLMTELKLVKEDMKKGELPGLVSCEQCLFRATGLPDLVEHYSF